MKYSLALFFSTLFLLSACVTFILPQKQSIPSVDLSGNKSIRSSQYQPISGKGQKNQSQVCQERVLISNNIRCIAIDDKNVWIASDKGVSGYDKNNNVWSHYCSVKLILTNKNFWAILSPKNYWR